MDTVHLLAAAFHVQRTHFLGHCLTLGYGNWSKALGLEEFDACALVTEVRLEADEDNRRGWTKVENFGIPLGGN